METGTLLPHLGGPPAARPARVLLIGEDGAAHGPVLEALRDGLEGPVTRVAGGAEALRLALEEPPFDLAVVDGRMRWAEIPGLAGHLRERFPDCPLLLLSPDKCMETAVAALKAGFDECLPRSSERPRLADAARGLVAGARARRRDLRAGDRLQDLLSRLGVGVYRATSRGVLLYANDAFCRLFGIPSWRDAPAWSLRSALADPADEARIARELRRTGFLQDAEVRLKGPGGSERWISLTQSLRSGSDTVGVIEGLVEDITVRKLAEMAARRREDELRQARSLETVGRLAGGVAHDFNNLLTAINGYGELLAASLDPSHPGKESLEEIRRAGARAALLTRQLLAFGGRMVLRPRRLDPNALLTGLQAALRAAAGPSVHVAFDLGPGLGPVRADPLPLEEAILGLVRNAREAMPQGGRLEVRTRRADIGGVAGMAGAPDGKGLPASGAGPSEAAGTDLAPGAYVMLQLEDSGHGMDREILARAFEPFFTTKPDALGATSHRVGIGMGLSTAYGILRQSGGAIRVDSERGRGTRVRLYLPLAAEPEAPGGADPKSPSP